jgi:hypothetical protein
VWSKSLEYGVVVLPVLLSLIGIHMSASLSKKQKGFLFTCGIAVGLLVFLQQHESRVSHEREINAQKDAIESLRKTVQTNEIRNAGDMSYLKAKLEDSERMNEKLSQFAPAVMRLAEASAEFTRKQYEDKITSNRELRKFTMGVVKNIRDFAQKYELAQRQLIDEQIARSRQAKSDVERQQIWNEETQKETRLYYTRDSEFRSSILPDVLYAKSELQKKKIPEPTSDARQKSTVDMVLRGILAGSYPELAVADYLELMARQLPTRD